MPIIQGQCLLCIADITEAEALLQASCCGRLFHKLCMNKYQANTCIGCQRPCVFHTVIVQGYAFRKINVEDPLSACHTLSVALVGILFAGDEINDKAKQRLESQLIIFLSTLTPHEVETLLRDAIHRNNRPGSAINKLIQIIGPQLDLSKFPKSDEDEKGGDQSARLAMLKLQHAIQQLLYQLIFFIHKKYKRQLHNRGRRNKMMELMLSDQAASSELLQLISQFLNDNKSDLNQLLRTHNPKGSKLLKTIKRNLAASVKNLCGVNLSGVKSLEKLPPLAVQSAIGQRVVFEEPQRHMQFQGIVLFEQPPIPLERRLREQRLRHRPIGAKDIFRLIGTVIVMIFFIYIWWTGESLGSEWAE